MYSKCLKINPVRFVGIVVGLLEGQRASKRGPKNAHDRQAVLFCPYVRLAVTTCFVASWAGSITLERHDDICSVGAFTLLCPLLPIS